MPDLASRLLVRWLPAPLHLQTLFSSSRRVDRLFAARVSGRRNSTTRQITLPYYRCISAKSSDAAYPHRQGQGHTGWLANRSPRPTCNGKIMQASLHGGNQQNSPIDRQLSRPFPSQSASRTHSGMMSCVPRSRSLAVPRAAGENRGRSAAHSVITVFAGFCRQVNDSRAWGILHSQSSHGEIATRTSIQRSKSVCNSLECRTQSNAHSSAEGARLPFLQAFCQASEERARRVPFFIFFFSLDRGLTARSLLALIAYLFLGAFGALGLLPATKPQELLAKICAPSESWEVSIASFVSPSLPWYAMAMYCILYLEVRMVLKFTTRLAQDLEHRKRGDLVSRLGWAGQHEVSK